MNPALTTEMRMIMKKKMMMKMVMMMSGRVQTANASQIRTASGAKLEGSMQAYGAQKITPGRQASSRSNNWSHVHFSHIDKSWLYLADFYWPQIYRCLTIGITVLSRVLPPNRAFTLCGTQAEGFSCFFFFSLSLFLSLSLSDTQLPLSLSQSTDRQTERLIDIWIDERKRERKTQTESESEREVAYWFVREVFRF